MQIKVLGPGCANCRTTAEIVEAGVRRHGLDIAIEKVEDVREIARLGVMSTPAVLIDGMVVHAGGIPTAERVDQWLDTLGKSPCCGGRKGCCN